MAKRKINQFVSKVFKPAPPTPAGLRISNTDDLPLRGGAGSEIDKLGMGSEVLRLRRSGLTYAEIGQQMGFTVAQVGDWVEKYRNRMSDQQKMIVHQRSIFDMGSRLEEIFQHLDTTLQEIKGSSNRELELKTADRILKAIDLAASLVEKIEMYKENQRFKEVVLDLLDQEAPGIKAKALKQLAQYKEGISALRPL
jgi:hypothetical protein